MQLLKVKKYGKKDAVYTAEQFVLQETLLSQKMQFIKESGFKSRAGYNGTCTVDTILSDLANLMILT